MAKKMTDVLSGITEMLYNLEGDTKLLERKDVGDEIRAARGRLAAAYDLIVGMERSHLGCPHCGGVGYGRPPYGRNRVKCLGPKFGFDVGDAPPSW